MEVRRQYPVERIGVRTVDPLARYATGNQEPWDGNMHAIRILPRVPSEMDVFTELPEDLSLHDRPAAFLKEVRRRLMEWGPENLRNIHLTKLRVSEQTSTSVTIEWIYNYFRVFFEFDDEEGDYCGHVMFDDVSRVFSNEYRGMNPSEYPELANMEVDYVIAMAGGGVSDGR